MTVADPEITTGFEHGAIIGVGSSSFSWWFTNTGDASIQSTIKRTGSYALKMKPTSTTAARAELRHATLTDISVRQYLYFATLPDANTLLLSEANTTFRTGIAFNSATSKLRAQSGSGPSFSADGPSVTTGVWYRIDFKVTLDTAPSPDTHTINWSVDGTAYETLVVSANTAGYIATLWVTSAVNGEYYIDDVVVAQSGYPIGEGVVVLLRPSGEGTHSTAGSFTDDAANSPPVTPHLRVDEIPISASDTDYFKQTTIGATDYIELTLEDLPAEAGEIQGVWAASLANLESAGSEDTNVNFFDPDTSTSTTIRGLTTSTSLGGLADGIGRAPWWTAALVNGCRLRIGQSADVTPNARQRAMFVEVGYTSAVGNDGWGWGDGQERWSYL